ncbi:MAG: chromate transporter [Synergistaceae bacterium]|nr:chromate transporter [Synergistaceae bacterium]
MLKRLLSIYTRFLRIGAFTIGGGIVMLGVIESEVRATGEFSDEEIADMIVLATAVPGPIATNLSFVAGKAMEGWAGAVAAVLGTATAPFLSILFLSTLIINHLDNPWLIAFFLGASAGVVAVVWNSLWKMIKSSVLVKGRGSKYAFTVLMAIGTEESEEREEIGEGGETRVLQKRRRPRRRICGGKWSLPPILAFIVTAWVITSWEVHPFIALIVGAVISMGGDYLIRKELEEREGEATA